MNRLKAITSLFCVPALAFAAGSIQKPNWDSTLAAGLAQAPASYDQIDELTRLAWDGDRDSLNARLDALMSNAAISQPQREFILFEFATALADLPEIDSDLISRLRKVRPTVMVSHEESAASAVPLFNIAAAAEGLYHLDQRRKAKSEAGKLLRDAPEKWTSSFGAESRTRRAGYVDAMDSASDASLRIVLESASEQLPTMPELTPVAGKAALLLGDVTALENLVINGAGSDLSRILEAAALTLSQSHGAGLLRFAVESAPAVNASLVIARFSPALLRTGDTGSTELLFQTLSDPELGASAALALARANTGALRIRLQSLANENEGLAGGRAALALGSERETGRSGR